MVKGPMKSNETDRERRQAPHIREIKIEGMMLHMRAIIEQGRTKAFLKELKENHFETIKGQKGLVAFVRDFINKDENARRSNEITGERAINFVRATQKKTRTPDKC